MRVTNQPRGCMRHNAHAALQTALGFQCYFPLYIPLMHCWRPWKRKRHKPTLVLAAARLKWMNLWNFAAATSRSFHRRRFRKERIPECFPAKLSLQEELRQHQNHGCKAASPGNSDRAVPSSGSPSEAPAPLLGERDGKRPVLRKPKWNMSQQQPSWGFFCWVV